MTEREPLLQLLNRLRQLNYRFTAVTPATHARLLSRPLQEKPTLRDVFGWNRPFRAEDLDPQLLRLMERADAVARSDNVLRSKVRVATLGDCAFLHSSFPTDAPDSVFFGPDTYRFVRFIQDAVPRLSHRPQTIVDMGTGSGAGGIALARLFPAARVKLVDINPAALRLAEVNAAAAGVSATFLQSAEMPAGDLIVANPPYIMDPAARAYRDGGELLGGAVAAEWVAQALRRLSPGGTMLLYSGAAVTGGRVPLIDELERLCTSHGADLRVEELDPDIFGEELDQPAYRNVERIAAIGAVIGGERMR